jgi:microcystin-dependent protein
MSFPLIVDGSSYQYPSQGDKANTGWGTQTGGWASAVTSALTKLGLGGTLSPLANTVIDISSTSKGILIPRMTTVQRNAITSVPNSLLIFNTTDKVLQYYDSSVGSWISVGARLPDNAIFSGTLTVTGGITGATGSFTDATDAVDVDTAPLKTLGGMAVKKKLFVGGAFNYMPAGTIIQTSFLTVPTGFLPCQGQNISRTNYADLFGMMPTTTSTITVTTANVINWTSHGLSTGNSVQFTTTGTLPTGITANTVYYVRVLTSATFNLYSSLSNAMNTFATTGQVTFTVSGSGTHTGLVYYYGNGDGSTTFTIPDFRGAVPRGYGTSNAYIEPATINIGEKTDDQLQGHVHNYLSILGAPPVYGGGGSYESANQNTDTGIPKDSGTTYGTTRIGKETRGKSLGINFLIKI